MRRFILTSPKMTGSIEVHYDMNDKLYNIMVRAELDADGLLWFKNHIPPTGMYINDSFSKSTVRVEEKEFEVSFADFKREYPYKRNTHLAEAYWPKLSSANQYRAFIGAIAYSKYCATRNVDKQFMKLPEKWLKEQQWLNDWDKL